MKNIFSLSLLMVFVLIAEPKKEEKTILFLPSSVIFKGCTI